MENRPVTVGTAAPAVVSYAALVRAYWLLEEGRFSRTWHALRAFLFSRRERRMQRIAMKPEVKPNENAYVIRKYILRGGSA